MKNKAIITDLDGTVVDSPVQKLPSKKLISVVTKLKESYYICAATGRPWSFAKIVLQSLGLTDTCIISAGTQLCDPVTGKILWQKNISLTALKKVVTVMKKYPEYKIIYNDYTEKEYLEGGILPDNFDISDKKIHFIEQIFVPETIAPELEKKLTAISGVTCTMVNAQRKGYKDLHVTHASATKEHAVAELLKRLSIKKQNTIGIGDGNNDVHLFASVKHKVAMGNAVNELQATADKVIGSVKEDGLATYFESLL